MKTFVINLERASHRKEFMSQQLCNFPFLDVEFVEAIDGRKLEQSEVNSLFDVTSFYKLYKRYPLPGEIGCTLSHLKCYEKLLKSDRKVTLILEDDACLSTDIQVIESIEVLDNIPQIILLTPRCSYLFQGKPIQDLHRLYNVFLGSCTGGYLINKSAANLILNLRTKPYLLADDWWYLRKHVKLQILVPSVVTVTEQNFDTQIQVNDGVKSNIFLKKMKLLLSPMALCHKCLKLMGHYSYEKH